MLTAHERAGLRHYLRSLPEGPAYRTPAPPAAANLAELLAFAIPDTAPGVALPTESPPPQPLASAGPSRPAADGVAACLAEALTGLKVLLDLARSLPLTRAAAVLVERVGKTSRRLESQLGELRSA